MLTLYLLCLLGGGAMLALSLFGGGEADADVDVSGDVDLTADADVAAEADLSAEADGAEDTGGEGWLAAVRFLSLRNLVFSAAFFGLTGTLLTLLRAPHLPTLVASIALGAAAAIAIDRVMTYLKRSETGTLRSLSVLGGVRARVLVGIDATHAGKVAVETAEQTQQLVARRYEKATVERFAAGDTVVIVRFQDGVALVAEPTYLA
jgi:hypothetical protein